MRDRILTAILRFLFPIRFRGLEKFPPQDTPCIICCNHLSLWDPILLYLFLPEKAHYLAKKELYEKPWLARFLEEHDVIPIDRDKPDLVTIKSALKVLKRGEKLGIFPQGTRKKTISLEDGKQGVGMFAYMAGVPALPIRIRGKMLPFTTVDVHIGTLIYPVDDAQRSKKEIYTAFSERVMQAIIDL